MSSKHVVRSMLAVFLLASAAFAADAKSAPKDPVAACWAAFQPGGWGPMTQCLQDAVKKEEAALADLLSKTAEQAKKSYDPASAEKTLAESNAQWVKYRDSECDRQLAFVAGRNHPDIGELTCRLRKTSERISDLRFDEQR